MMLNCVLRWIFAVLRMSALEESKCQPNETEKNAKLNITLSDLYFL